MSLGLEAFQAVAETGTVRAAAIRIGLTQTAVTQRVKGLERELGLTLFLRSRRGMGLTDDGTELLRHCRSVEELEGVLFSRISGPTRVESSLLLVGPTSAISTRIARDCEPLYARFPHLRLHLRSDDQADRVELVRRGEADLAVVSPETVPNEMESKRLRPDRYLLVATSAWKGRKLSEILETERVIDFAETDPTTTSYLEHFDLASRVRRTRLFVNENEALIRLFASGVGYGTLTETVAQPYLADGSLLTLNRGQAVEEPLALVWYPRPQRPDYFEALVRAVR